MRTTSSVLNNGDYDFTNDDVAADRVLEVNAVTGVVVTVVNHPLAGAHGISVHSTALMTSPVCPVANSYIREVNFQP